MSDEQRRAGVGPRTGVWPETWCCFDCGNMSVRPIVSLYANGYVEWNCPYCHILMDSDPGDRLSGQARRCLKQAVG